MSKEYARYFYSSEAWNRCREAYRRSVGGLCEMCLERGKYNPGEIVHHIKPLTPANIHDNHLTLNWGNLKLLCRECHAEVHGKKPKRYAVGPNGCVIGNDDIPPVS